MSSKYTEYVICLYCNKEVIRIMSSKYTENVICLYCNKEVIRIMLSKYTENVMLNIMRMSFVCTVTKKLVE